MAATIWDSLLSQGTTSRIWRPETAQGIVKPMLRVKANGTVTGVKQTVRIKCGVILIQQAIRVLLAD
jgi:hypothetical protein